MLYLPKYFRVEDREAVFAHIERVGLATLVTVGKSGPLISHVPLVLERPAPGADDGQDAPVHGRLIGHLSRANPQIRETDVAQPAVAIFHGPHAYISPSWYPSKTRSHEVVPTWNYAVVHAEGSIRFVDDTRWLRDQVARLTAHHESSLERPWSVSDAPEAFVERELRGIIGVELVIGALAAKYKLSQNRSEADRQGAMEGLAARGRPEDRAVLALMEAKGPEKP